MSFLSRPVASRRQVLRKLRTLSCSATLQELPGPRAARLEVLRELRHTGVITIASRRKAEFNTFEREQILKTLYPFDAFLLGRTFLAGFGII